MSASPLKRRTSGLLLHPTSLPSPHGIGDLGAEARAFVDFLQRAGQSWWQVLPVTPPAFGDSPYTSVSAFAGNPLLIDLRGLVQDGLLTDEDVALPPAPGPNVDFGWVWSHKRPLLERAFSRFTPAVQSRPELHDELEHFKRKQRRWLDDYAMYLAIHEAQGWKSWPEWERDLRDREPEALKRVKKDLGDKLDYHRFVQFVFHKQWQALRRYAKERHVSLLGDLPIFVALDSADVWAHRDIFKLDKQGQPKVVAGVPPDYFSEEGQLWGNPLYDWEALKERDYDWWVDRLGALFEHFDAVRIDHFIGFYRAWHVPAGAKTAKEGKYVPGPRSRFFERVEKKLGKLPIVAEDLGAVTPEVWALRDEFGFPGMRVLQFAFGSSSDSEHLPHTYTQNSVVYTGTHDNDTTAGWWRGLEQKINTGAPDRDWAANVRRHLAEYVNRDPEPIHWTLIRLALMSAANTAIFPVQDLLGLTSEARMNVPGVAQGNWSWRLPHGALHDGLAADLSRLTHLYGRVPRKD